MNTQSANTEFAQTQMSNISAAQQTPNIGENGTLQLSTEEVGDIRVAIFSNICRDTPEEKIAAMTDQYIAHISEDNRREYFADLGVLLFEKRDCRGGEGEKRLFTQFFGAIRRYYPSFTLALLPLVPEFGSWLDVWKISALDPSIRPHTYQLCAAQLRQDIQSMENGQSEKISLCAKWAPSEGTALYKAHAPFTAFLRLLFPEDATPQKTYRKTIVKLRDILKVAETRMCSGRYQEIVPKQTPSVCAFKNRKAFLNISLDRSKPLDNVNGNRYPDNPDRVRARQLWLENVKIGAIKGGQLDPKMLVTAARKAQNKDEIDMINAQWNDLVAKTRAQIAESIEKGYAPATNVISLIDRSGSMSGGPDDAAIGLGILLSEIADPRYGNMVITFSETPSIVQLDPRRTFHERVMTVCSFEQGCSTNFQRAMNLVLNFIKTNRIMENDFPAICILTDEQMNSGTMFGYSRTVDEGIKREFAQLGMEMIGEPFSRPRTIHWNLRGDTKGHPVTAHENNVQAITGYNASLLELVLTGCPAPTPYSTMRRKLDNERYDPIREIVAKWVDETFP